MTVRPGQFGESINAAIALGAAAGRSFALNNSAWGVLVAAFVAYVATSTAGSRAVTFQVKDAAGNILFQTAAATAITVSQTPKLVLAAGIPASSIAAPLMQFVSLPVELPIGPLSTVNILDSANIDVNDTVAPNFVFAM